MTKTRDLADLGGGFIQVGTGAVQRTVESKLQDVVSVKDFGAVGDGVADDTAEIDAAKAAHPNSVIDLGGDTYLVTSIAAGWGYQNGLLVLDPANTDDQPQNEAYGYGALSSNTYVPKQHSSSTLTWASGNFNAAFGSYALGNNTTGRRNTAFGSVALRLNAGGYYNTAVGSWALNSNIAGNYNTAVGVQALQFCTASNNTAVGNGALVSNSNGEDNVAIGSQALALGTLNRTIAIGRQAGWYHTGSDSVAIGYQALSASSSSGLYNVVIGSAAGASLTTGNSNVAMGRRALAASSTGSNNTAIGNDAMVSAGNGDSNTALGGNTLQNNTTGYQNTAVGRFALTANQDGFNNSAVGRYSLGSCTSGAGNVAVGEQALYGLTSANYCSALGSAALSTNSTFGNCSGVGYNSQVTAANQVQLGDAFTTTYAYGAVQNRSDERDKADIRNTMLGLEFINSLRPVDFRWNYRESYREIIEREETYTNDNGEDKIRIVQEVIEHPQDGSKKRNRYHHGLIAQEVKAACDAAGIDFGGYQDHSINGGKDVLSVGYTELIAPLIKAVQQLSAEVEQLKSQIHSSAASS